MIELLLVGITAGVVGTLFMDFVNFILARTGLLSKIDIAMIGRMSAGWMNGRFLYRHPDEMQTVSYERTVGWFTHYVISIVFALIYVFGWHFLIEDPVSPTWAIVYGFSTTAASQFLVFPSVGFGVFGHRSPEGIKAPLSSLVNHLFFGVGMAIVIVFA